jgi:hypothetical protein
MPKLDPELARQILIEAEAVAPTVAIGEIGIGDIDPLLVSYHIKMLDEAGLLTGLDCSTMGGLHWKVKSLTFQGHKFLDSIRNDTTWTTIKKEAGKRGLDLSIEVIKVLAMKLLSAAI